MRTLTVDSELSGADVALSEHNAHYVGRVLRLAAGDALRIVDAAGNVWVGVLTFREGIPWLTALDSLESGQGGAPLILLSALIKGPRFEYVLEKATELGADVILPFVAARSIVKIPDAKLRSKQERWQRVCDSAIRQCKRPGRALVMACAPSLSDALDLASTDGASLVALNEQDPGAKWPADLSGPVALVVGPEGGFTNSEVDLLRQAGAHFAGLGPTILRAETATAAAVSTVRMVRAGLIQTRS
ncbi:MAG: 16S rRNA (uracil1498-N3)-methyltransferase [Bradymonadia bacterium]|jgi:16S rRNA (uracil1498-N3)-methyltransferase